MCWRLLKPAGNPVSFSEQGVMNGQIHRAHQRNYASENPCTAEGHKILVLHGKGNYSIHRGTWERSRVDTRRLRPYQNMPQGGFTEKKRLAVGLFQSPIAERFPWIQISMLSLSNYMRFRLGLSRIVLEILFMKFTSLPPVRLGLWRKG